MTDPKSISRREFMGRSALAAAGLMIVPRHVLGRGYTAPSDLLNMGCVGAWGRGADDIAGVSTENIVAICDVDDEMMARLLTRPENTPEQKAKYEKAHKYRDFRQMLDKEKGLDAVTVGIPDHSHAIVAITAMKLGKHVYCEKPLTHTVKEARLMAETAKKMNVVTQMGNQGHAKEGARLLNEWIWDGAIGPVSEVHVWTNRPIWPQGIEAPTDYPSCPPSLDWDVWLGPAPWRAYNPAYHPFAWRGWWDFGTGALGDMGAHLIDQPFWALNLGAPKSVQASSTKFNKDSYPVAEIITYEFDARGKMPPCKLIWYDGGLTPARPLGLDNGRMLGDDGGGCLFVGSKGSLLCGTYGQNPRLLPEKLMQDYKRPEKSIPRSPGIHEDWIAAIKAGTKSTTDFSYSGPLTELMLLGNIAVKVQEQKIVLEWDPAKMQFPNYPDANQYVHFEYRQGWSL
jgi:predicted dehydrogenase